MLVGMFLVYKARNGENLQSGASVNNRLVSLEVSEANTLAWDAALVKALK